LNNITKEVNYGANAKPQDAKIITTSCTSVPSNKSSNAYAENLCSSVSQYQAINSDGQSRKLLKENIDTN